MTSKGPFQPKAFYDSLQNANKNLFSVSSIKFQFQKVMNVSEKHNMNFWKRWCGVVQHMTTEIVFLQGFLTPSSQQIPA